jgi:Fe-S-cluster containining protein
MPQRDATEAFLESLPELAPDETFRFSCHPGVSCFNACCGDLNLVLTPYDTLRLRQGLSAPSREFLPARTETAFAPDTGFPMVRLRMRDDERKSCPFVREAGCSVYAHRPAACRTYPLGRATRLDEAGNVRERFFVVREDHCRGFAEERTWTSGTWLADQGLAEYNSANDRYMRLLARWKATGRRIEQKRAGMLFLALYQPDDFARFVRDMKLFEKLEVDAARQAAVLANEAACLDFGLDWLALVLFGPSETLHPRR